jgi:hypothetical protein
MKTILSVVIFVKALSIATFAANLGSGEGGKESSKVGIRLTQVTPICGAFGRSSVPRAATYTRHLSEADTHLLQKPICRPKRSSLMAGSVTRITAANPRRRDQP